MTIVLLIVAAWFVVGLVGLLGICRAAAAGDRSGARAEGWTPRRYEHTLAA